MSKCLYALCMCTIISYTLCAQPTITNAGKFKTDVSYFSRIVPTHYTPVDPPGINQFWDYSWLNDSNNINKRTCSLPTGLKTPNPANDVKVHESDANYTYYYDIRNTGTYVTGDKHYEADMGGPYLVEQQFPKPLLHIPHKMNYNDVVTDTTRYVNSLTETRVRHFHADAYGTLVTPADTYYNVLRIVRTYSYKDTNSNNFFSLGYTAYKWYVNDYPVPVLTINKYDDGKGNVKYYGEFLMFEEVLGVENIVTARNISAYLTDRQIVLNGEFNKGSTYKLSLLGMNGQLLFEQLLRLDNGTNTIRFQTDVPAGNYLLRIVNTDVKETPVVLKLNKV